MGDSNEYTMRLIVAGNFIEENYCSYIAIIISLNK